MSFLIAFCHPPCLLRLRFSIAWGSQIRLNCLTSETLEPCCQLPSQLWDTSAHCPSLFYLSSGYRIQIFKLMWQALQQLSYLLNLHTPSQCSQPLHSVLVVPRHSQGAARLRGLHREKSQEVKVAGWADADMHRVSSP